MSDNLENERNNKSCVNCDNNYSRNLFIGSNIFSFVIGFYFHYLIEEH